MLDLKKLDALLPKLETLLDHWTDKLDAEARLAEFEEEDVAASADTHRVYTLFTPFMPRQNFEDREAWDAIKDCIETLSMWSRRDDEKDITVLLNSPGGYCTEGWALFDWFKELRRRHKAELTIVGLGQVSSMASVLMQAATHRVMHRNAWMLIHEVLVDPLHGYYDQKVSIQREELEFAERMERQGSRVLAERSKLSVKDIERLIAKRDWWLSAKQALEYGFIDEVR